MYPSYLFAAEITLLELAGTARTLLGYLLTVTLFSLPLLIATSLLSTYLRKRKQIHFASTLLRTAILFQILLCVVAAFIPTFQVSIARHNVYTAFAKYRATSQEQRVLAFHGFNNRSPEPIRPSLVIEFNPEPRMLQPFTYITATGIWITVSLFFLLGLVCSVAYLYRLQRRSTTLSSNHPVYRLLGSVRHASQKTLLKIAEEVHVPFAVGPPIAAQAIFLPADWDLESSPLHTMETARAVLAHEAEHLQRQDPFWNATGRLLAALFWTNPLQWLLLREMDRVQELICDEKAMQSFAHDRDLGEYAKCLLQFSAITTTPYYLRHGSAAIVKAHPSFIEERIQNIMSGKSSSRTAPIGTRFRIGLLSGAALFVGGSLFFATQTAPAAQLPQIAQSSPSQKLIPVIDARDEVAKTVLQQVLKYSGLELAIDKNVEPLLERKISFKATDQPIEKMIAITLRCIPTDNVPLGFKITGNKIHIFATKVDTDGLPIKTVSLNYVRSTNINTILEDLFLGTGFTVDGFYTNQNSTARFRVTDMPLSQALPKILQLSAEPLQARVNKTQIEISLVNPQPKIPVITKELPVKPVSADFKDTSLRTALETLFSQARCDFSIANEVSGTVTDQFKDLPLNIALPRILSKSSPPSEYVVQDGVVIVRLRGTFNVGPGPK
jgi:beta-lactamase regulating signal transducer with metallopeptidase domain